ncbi:MAG: ABC transporter permease [Acidiferrobacterales bacterium]|nr:ABC transporter permease [Acidiferrobacterales bacterium]
MGLTRLIAKRIAFGLITLIVITLLISLALEALPGDFAEQRLGQTATPETIAAIRAQLGLNEPILVRYWQWLSKFLQGDMGVSLSNSRPVSELLATRLGNTLFLASSAAIVAVPLALFLGILAALYRESLLDKMISTSTLAAISLPEFFVGYILVALFAVNWQFFPAISSISDSMTLGEKIYASLLPIATLTLVIVAHMMRMTRAAIINLMQSPFIEMATLKGLKRSRIIVHHALPNALSPIINVIVLNLAYLVVGVVVVEVVFIYPGLGLLMIDSVTSRDLPIVQACILIFGATYISLNMLADILSIISNPRLRHPR